MIIGGAWQGKLDLAKREYGLSDEDVFTCGGGEIDFSRRCIYRLEEFTLACAESGRDPLAYFQAREQEWQNAVIICRDIFCGVVPMDAAARRWRNETGCLCRYLAGKAERVSRVFCGLEQRLK